jgi:hypothetical protein
MRFLVNRDKAQLFDNLVHEFREKQTEELLTALEETGIDLIFGMLQYYADLSFDHGFAKSILLDCLQRVFTEKEGLNPTRILRSVTHNQVKTMLDIADMAIPPVPENWGYQVDVHSRLVFEETLHDVLFLLPLHVQSAVLYLVLYPTNDHKFRLLYSPLDYFLILRGIQELRKALDIGHQYNSSFDFELPESQTARLLTVSSLYKLSPALLVLIMQTKDVSLALQFCKLFGGQTVKIPRISEVYSALSRAADLAQKVENGVCVGDQESLMYLATDIADLKIGNRDYVSLNPLLSSFIEKSLDITLNAYENSLRRLISEMDTTNLEDITLVFKHINKEVLSQTYLLLQLTTSINDYREIQKIMSILKPKI